MTALYIKSIHSNFFFTSNMHLGIKQTNISFILTCISSNKDKNGFFLVAQLVKSPSANAGDTKTHRFDPWAGKIPWRRKWQPTPVFLPGKFHGQRWLAG